MLGVDLLLMLFVFLQPPFVGMLLFALTKQGLTNKAWLTNLRFIRKKPKGTRFFECAVFPRLLGALRYDIQAVSFALIFVVYDIDLALFVPEAIAFDRWSSSQAVLFALYFMFFLAGLWYDVQRQGLTWSY